MVMHMATRRADAPTVPAAPAALAAAWLAAAAAAQQVPVPGGPALGTSFRVQQVDLSPSAFRNVYKVPGRDDLLMRTDGALYAVFDQSVYVRDPKAKGNVLKPIIPAATVFYIGKPNFRMIRGTGVRDISFQREDLAWDPSTSKAKTSLSGVTRLEPRTGVSASADRSQPTTIGGRPVHVSNEDVSYPPVARTAGAPAGAEPAPEPTRAERPGFERRIDELMDRAKKAQPGTP